MKKDNTKSNIVYNILYQLVITVIPLITTPYLSRVLGKNGIGIYSYTQSIAHYFVLFAMLGLTNYGNRAIAQVRDEKGKCNEVFSEIYTMQFFLACLASGVYFLGIIVLRPNYYKVFIAQGLYVLSTMFDVSWFFYGKEEFKKVLAKNFVFRIAVVFGIFFCINDVNDILKYTIVMAGGTLLSQIWLWKELNKHVVLCKIKFTNVIKHFVPNLTLFIPVLAVSIYRYMDKVMLGLFSSIEEVGLYENADKIVTMPLTIIVSIGTVMMPKMSNLYVKRKYDQMENIIENTLRGIVFLSLGMSFGMISIAERFATLYFGEEFQNCGELIIILAPIIVFASIGNVVRTQCLIPMGKDKSYILSVFCGAILNVLINLSLIKEYGAIGVSVGTLCTEFTVMFVQCVAVRKYICFKKIINNTWYLYLAGVLMYLVVYHVGDALSNTFVGILIQVLIGTVTYCCLSIMFYIINKKLNKQISV